MGKRKIAFKFAKVPIYESDLSKGAVARLNKELVNQFNNDHRELTKVEIAEAGILTAKTLKKMLLVTLKKENELKVIEAILSNPNLKELDEESWKALSEHRSLAIRKIAVQCRFTTEERLKEMLKRELKARKKYSDIIKAILSNPKLKEIDEESWKALSKHKSWEIRRKVAQFQFATEERLKEMLKHELKARKKEPDIINKILSNQNLKEIDEENWKALSEHEDWIIREIAEKSRFATEERLKEMLKHELKAGRDSNSEMIKVILSNPKLKEIDEESWKVLSEHENWAIRRIAAQSRFATEERLKEMFKHEVKAGKDSYVIKAINSNPNFKNDEETSL